jgi:eukaryotic-like serine/threonine-protein kinase
VPVYSVQDDKATGLTAFCMPYLGRATLCDVLDRAWLESAPPRRARLVLDAILAANDGSEPLEPISPDGLLRSGSYLDGVLHLAVQLADALAHAHRRGVYHRDLKPSNVLMSLEGRPLLLDFNLSVDGQLPAPRVGGTLPYMAPEELAGVLHGDTESPKWYFDPRSDLFSFGVILYELLAGCLPFGTIAWDRPVKDLTLQLRQRQIAGPCPLSEKNCQVDKRLARLIHRCLAFDPEERPETAADLSAALRRELTPWRRGRRWIGDHRRQVTVSAAVFLAIFLTGATYLALRPPYGVRQLQRGLAYSEQGRYELALECLDRAVRSAPESDVALFARGRAYQQLGNFRQAFEDFDAACRLAPTPQYYASSGYCLSKMNYHNEAIDSYRKALAGGFETAGLLNDLGFSCLQLHRLREAEESLKRAVEVDVRLQAAHHSLVLVFLRQGQDGKAVPPIALDHAKMAIETGPPSGDLYMNVAALYALAAKQDDALVKSALKFLEKAVEYGGNLKQLDSSPTFSRLRKEQAFQELLTHPSNDVEYPHPFLLVDPI